MKLFCLLMFFSLLFPLNSNSGSYSSEYVGELTSEGKLPDFCPYMGHNRKINTELGKKLNRAYGNNWIHMHHFCWALIDLQRGKDKEAIQNLDYVLKNVSMDFKLRPMVLKQKAQTLIVNNNYSAAVIIYQELVNVDPYSEDGYLGLVKIFQLQGDDLTALQITRLGLEKIPDSTELNKLNKILKSK